MKFSVYNVCVRRRYLGMHEYSAAEIKIPMFYAIVAARHEDIRINIEIEPRVRFLLDSPSTTRRTSGMYAKLAFQSCQLLVTVTKLQGAIA